MVMTRTKRREAVLWDALVRLVESRADGDDKRFFAIAMRAAGHAARSGEGKLAIELRELVDRAIGAVPRSGVRLQHPKVERRPLIAPTNPPRPRRVELERPEFERELPEEEP